MAKKSSLLSMLLGVVLILALVYFLRPQTFDFLKQGFVNPDEEEDFEDLEDEEGFEDLEDEEAFEDIDDEEGFYVGVTGSGTPTNIKISCKNKDNKLRVVTGTSDKKPECPPSHPTKV